MPLPNKLFFAILLALSQHFLLLAQAQTDLSPTIPTAGVYPFGSYMNQDAYSIDLQTGSLMGQIPLQSYPQKGALSPLNFFINIGNPRYILEETCEVTTDSCFTYRDISANYVSADWNTLGASFASGGPGAVLLQDETVINNVSVNCGAPGCVDYDLAEFDYSVQDSTGASHQMLYDASSATPNFNSASTLYAADGSGYTVRFPAGTNIYDLFPGPHPAMAFPTTAPVIDANGVSSTTHYGDGSLPYANVISDLNGNTITVEKNDNGDTTTTDSVNRVFTSTSSSGNAAACPDLGIPNQPASGSALVTLPGPNGSATYILCGTIVQYHTNFYGGVGASANNSWPLYFYLFLTETGCMQDCGESLDVYGSFTALQSIVLPDGTYWGFVYDSSVYTPTGQYGTSSYDYTGTEAYGAITKIIYPSGGTATFDNYKMVWFTDLPGDGTQPLYNVPTKVTRNDGVGGITTKTYSFGPTIQTTGTPILTSNGQYSPTSWAYSNEETDLNSGNTIRHTFTDIYPAIDGEPGTGQYYETATDYFQGSDSGPKLKSVTRNYQWKAQTPTNWGFAAGFTDDVLNVQLASTNTTQDGILLTQTAETYPAFATGARITCIGGGQTASDDCQYGTAPITINLNSNPISLVSDGNGNPLTQTINTPYYLSHPTYKTANLLNLLQSTEIDDAAGATAGKTTFGYDEGMNGVFGDQTSVTRWLNTGTDVKTRTTYHADGMPATMIDGVGNTTTINYDLSGLYPQEIQQMATNGIPHNAYYKFEPNSGRMFFSVDSNGSSLNDSNHMTNYSYDVMGRLLSVQGPPISGSGSGRPTTTYCYSDMGSQSGGATCSASGPPYKMYATVSADPDPEISSVQTFDGFGRPIGQTIGSGTTTTTYNSAGLVGSVQSATGLTTNFYYDALGRKTHQSNSFDSASMWWCYDNLATASQPNCSSNLSGASSTTWTDTTDELGHHQQQATDALGRLAYVFEPDNTGSLNLKTQYAYDGLSNLISVAQLGGSSDTPRNRSFTYDSLSRLICASNPENSTNVCQAYYPTVNWTGVVTYSYDANSNLRSKKDAANVTTSFSYDALNRILSKSSSSSGTAVNSSCFQYDTAPNGNGLLGTEWTQDGTCTAAPTASSAFTETVILAYNSSGQPISLQQCVMGNCAAGSPFTLTQSYNLAGGLHSWSDGMNTNLFTQTYDSVGRPQTVSSLWSDAWHPATLFSVPSGNVAGCGSMISGYSPAGQLQAWSLGTNLNAVRCYDQRQRVTSEIVANP